MADAELVATYGRYAGSFRDDVFLVTLGQVLDIDPPRRTSHEAIVKLQMLLNDASKLIPFTTLTELKNGWTPHQSVRSFWRRTAGLLVMSIALMVVTTQLTYKYNKASTILQELAVLSSSEVRRDFNQLIRDFMQARSQLSGLLEDSGSNEGNVAWPAYQASEADLAALSDRLKVGYDAAASFVADDARFLVWPSKQLYCLFRRPSEVGNDFLGFVRSQAYVSACGVGGLDLPEVLPEGAGGALTINALQLAPEAQCRVPPTREGGEASGNSDDAARAPELSSFNQVAQGLVCAGVISFPPRNFSGFATYTSTIQETLTFLGLGILPALYGALGTIMYHMRMILDPLRPNPPFFRVFHRAILGALAGIVLSWLFIPDTAVGEAFAGIGFSLFVLAFLFGFSLDIFFAVLDRFVNLSVSGIGRFGAPQAVQVAAAPLQPAPASPRPLAAPPRTSVGPDPAAPEGGPSSAGGAANPAR